MQNQYSSFKIFFLLCFFVCGTFASIAQEPRMITSRDYSILVEAEVESAPTPKIKLKWRQNEFASFYQIQRKNRSQQFWNTVASDLNTNDTVWVDEYVKAGNQYEYEIIAYSSGRFIDKKPVTNEDTTVTGDFRGYGYILVSLDAQIYDKYGKAILLIDETIEAPLQNEIDEFAHLLEIDGWNVVKHSVPRTEKFDGDAVKYVKNIIYDEMPFDYNYLNTVIIIGRVAVPYSGNIVPDGHPDHVGAWPADMYYGHLNESIWSDNQVYNTTAKRKENQNVYGDGKFDVSQINDAMLKLAVGRIDFYDMPDFDDNDLSEIELLRLYLQKNIRFRKGLVNVQHRALIDDNFGTHRYLEGFGSSGWRNFGPLVGINNIHNVDFFTKLSTDSYLWSYGCGGGTYISAGGIGTTKDFAEKQVNGIFSFLFGSYFGDWDTQNNFLRASIASQPSVLTSGWAGRPHWYVHYMGVGEPIGNALLLTQNNSTLYRPNWVHLLQNPGGTIYTSGNRSIHIALMGDPTLRMYSGNIEAPKDLSVTQNTDGFIQLNWAEPETDGIIGYFVYIKHNNSNFIRLNEEQISSNSFIDENIYDGELQYLVKAVQNNYTPSGSFFNMGIGALQKINVSNVEEKSFTDYNIELFPNPVINHLNIAINISNPQTVIIEIFNTNATIVKRWDFKTLASGQHSLRWDLTSHQNNKVSNGVYLLKIQLGNTVVTEKVIVY